MTTQQDKPQTVQKSHEVEGGSQGDDDDEYDQFDDVLDQFTSQKPPPVPPNTTSPSVLPSTKSSLGPEAAGIPGVSDELTLAFQKELMKGMEDLFKGLSASDGPTPLSPEGETQEEKEERERGMKALWEAMLIEEMDGGNAEGHVGDGKGLDLKGTQLGEEYGGSSKEREAVGKDGVKDSKTGKEKEAGKMGDFQKTIRATMEKLKDSQSTLQSEAPSDEALSALLSQLSSLGENVGEENEEALQGLLENMMGQLMGRDILEEPLTELAGKFPSYIEQNKTTLSPDDLKRYQSQSECVTKILNVFKDPAYKEDDVEWNSKIVNLMSEMQSHGSPPAEIMGPLPPGFGLGPDGMPALPEGCVVA